MNASLFEEIVAINEEDDGNERLIWFCEYVYKFTSLFPHV